MTIAVHVTHEAIQKMGGIGTVLHGLITAKTYQKKFAKTLLYSPLFHRKGDVSKRVGLHAEVLYSGLDRFEKGSWRKVFAPIEQHYGVHIIYGKKKIQEWGQKDGEMVDIVAVDIWDMKPAMVDDFKFRLWQNFGVQSERYQHDMDYEQYMRIGPMLRDIMEAIYGKEEPCVLFSHEYMGMPAALSFEIDKKEGRRTGDTTIFYAHEVSTARQVVEGHPGHDLSFYNILGRDVDSGVSLEDEFGSYQHYSRNELVKLATKLDYVFAVSALTKEEFLYLCPKADPEKIKVVYNGIYVDKHPYSKKEKSVEMVGEYCERLFNFSPDYIFTHVSRLVISKAIWRDIRFLYHLDEHLAKKGKKGFYVLLSTLIGEARSHENIISMEDRYGWPVIHREGWPDLVGAESDIYHQLEIFNARSRAIKGIFVNQFGFSRSSCGNRVPEGLFIEHLRLASDLEFGMSIYEPFGIAQLETLPYGGIPLVNSKCGCTGLLQDTMEEEDYLVVDFADVPSEYREVLKNKHDFMEISKELRDRVETEICRQSAPRVAAALPKNARERKAKFERMQKRSRGLDWEHVAARISGILGK